MLDCVKKIENVPGQPPYERDSANWPPHMWSEACLTLGTEDSYDLILNKIETTQVTPSIKGL